jgi:hypothetical protein
MTEKAPCLRASLGSLTIWNSGVSLVRAKYRKDGAVAEMVDGVVAPLIGGNHAPIEPENLIEFPSLECHREFLSLPTGLMERDQNRGWLAILRPSAAISHQSFPCRT